MKRIRIRRFAGLWLALSCLVNCAESPPPAAAAPEPGPGATSAPAAVGSEPAAEPAATPSSAKVEQAIEAIKGEDFARAKLLLNEARQANPNDPQAAFYLGVALQGLSDVPGAAMAYKQALKLDPKLTDASVNLSALLLDAKDAAGALSVVDAALPNAPKQPDLLLNRALALEGSGKQDEALQAYAAAVQASPQNAELRIAYAELLTNANQEQKALEQLRELTGTDDVRLLAALAQKFGRLKAFPDCVQALDKAVATKPRADLLVRRGVCRHGQGDDAGALADYRAAIKLDDKFAPAHYYLGMHLCPKDKRGAQAQLKKASELAGAEELGKRAKLAFDRAKAGKCGE